MSRPGPRQQQRSFLPGIATAVSTAGPARSQQDACYSVRLPGCNLVAVADGIGSLPDSHITAGLAVLSATGYIQRSIMANKPMSCELLHQAFQVAHNDCRSSNALLRAGNPEAGGGTTLIVACQTERYFYAGLCGDGNAAHLLATAQTPNYVLEHQRRTQHLGHDRHEVQVNIQRWVRIPAEGGIVVIATDGVAIRGDQGKGLVHVFRQVRAALADASHRASADLHGLLEELITSGEPINERDNRSLGVLVDQDAIEWLGGSNAGAA